MCQPCRIMQRDDGGLRQNIKAFIRVRPALRSELEDEFWKLGLDVEDVEANWIQLRKDGEGRRHFSRVFGPHAQQGDIFHAVARPAIDDALIGHKATILCYGQTGTGKTHTMSCNEPGNEGIVSRALTYIYQRRHDEAHLYDTSVTMEYFQLYMESVLDMWDIEKVDLPIRQDDVELARVAGATVFEPLNAVDALRHVQRGDENRVIANTKLSSSSNRSHVLLLIRIERRNRTSGARQTGSLSLVDLAGSERVAKSGVEGDAFKEAFVINKSLLTLGRCVQGLIRGEQVAAFRDAKLTRLLQGALCGVGRTAFICTVRPDLANVYETSSTLAFAERAQEVQTGMTATGFREAEVRLRLQLLNTLRDGEEEYRRRRFVEHGVQNLERRVDEARQLVVAYATDIEGTLQGLRTQLLRDQNDLLAQHQAQLAVDAEAAARAVDEIRQSHAATFKRYDERVAFAVVAEERQHEKVFEQVNKRRVLLSQELEKSWAALREVEPDEEPIADKMQRKRAVLEVQIDNKNRMRRNCRQSANANLSLDELRTRIPHQNLVRETLAEHREMLLAKCEAFNVRPRTRWREGKRELPTHFDLVLYADKLHERKVEFIQIAARELSSSSSSSLPEATSSDASTATWGTSLLSGSSSESTFGPQPLPWDDGMDETGSSIEVIHDRYDTAVQEEEDLAKMKENVFRALHTGVPVYMVYPPNDWTAAALNMPPPANRVPTRIVKAFMALNRDRTGIFITPTDERLGEAREVFFRDFQVTLGQYSPSFAAATDNMPAVQSGTPMPPTSARLVPEAIPLFFYRSFTLTLSNSRAIMDFIVNSDADFEAWCAAFLFLGFLEPVWGRTLDISTSTRFEELTEGEKMCCAYHHIFPEQYLRFREALARFDPPLLFLTPMRIRELAGVDVLHSFKLLSFLVSNGDVESVKLYCNQYKHFLQQEALADLDREIVKALRIRIINMLRRYRPSPAAVVQQYLRDHEGREQEVLDALVEQYGAEPTDIAEVAADDALVEDTEENIEKSSRERRIEEAEVRRFAKYGFMIDMSEKAFAVCSDIDLFMRTKYASDTLAARLDVLRRSILTHEWQQRAVSQFIDLDCVTRPWYIDLPAQYRSLLGEVHEFVNRSVLEPGADKCLLVLGGEGSGKSALCRFIFQYYLCKLDLDSLATNAMNSNGIQLLTAASTGSTTIPILIDVAASSKPFEQLLVEGLSKTFGVHFGHRVPEGSLEQPLITLENLQSLDMLFLVDGLDEVSSFSEERVHPGDGVMLELLRRFAPSVNDDPQSRIFGSNGMDKWKKSKFVFTCRHLPQARSDRLNTGVHDFVKAFVAPTARADKAAADLERVSVLYIAPLTAEKQQQYFYRYILVCLREASRSRTMAVHTSMHNMTFFQRGFAGVDYFSLELRKVRDWFIYARCPGLLEHLAVALPYLSQQPDTDDKRARNTLGMVMQQSIEATIREQIEVLGLDNVPAELKHRDARQALQLYCFETALALARSHRSRITTPWLSRPTTSRLGMVPLTEDTPVSYFKRIGPFCQIPLFSSGLNPTVVTLRRHPKAHTRMFAIIADETMFSTRQVQDYYTALVASKQLLTTPSDTTMLLNQISFTKCEVVLRLLYDHVGRDKLFTLIQLAKKAGGALNQAASNAVSALSVCGTPLVGLDLSGLALSEANLRYALLEQANLSHTKLHTAILCGAQLSRAQVTGASLKGAMFKDWARVRENDMLMTVALSSTGKVLVTGGFEGNITMYDAPTGRELAVITGHTGCVTGVAMSSTGRVIASSSEDGSVRAWEAATGEQRFKFVGHEDSVTCVTMSPDDRLIASGSDDHTIIIWSMETGETAGQLVGHKGTVWNLHFSPNSRKLISASEDGRIVAWSTDRKYKFLATLATFEFPMKSVRYSHNGEVIAAGGDDGGVYLFESTGDPIARLDGHTDAVWSVAFSPTAPLLISGSADRSVRIWDHEACVEVASFHWHSHELRSVGFSADGSMIYSAACDKTAKLGALFLDASSSISYDSFAPSSICDVCFCEDRTIMFNDARSLNVVEALSGDIRRRWEARETLTCSYFAPQQHAQRVFMVGSAEFRAVLLNEGPVKQSTRLDAVHMVHEHDASPVIALHASADGTTMATATADGMLRIFSIVSTLTPNGHDCVEAQIQQEIPCDDLDRINCLRVSRDGEVVVVAAGDGTIRLFATNDGAEIVLLEGHRSAVLCVAISPDQRVILSGSADKTVRLWDSGAGVEVLTFTGHLAPVTAVALAPSAKEAFSGSLDGTVRVWDVLAGQETAAIVTHNVSCLAVSDDAKVLVTGGFDGTVRVMTKIDLHWCVVQQIGSRRLVQLVAHDLRGLADATDKTKAVSYLLESLSNVQLKAEKKKKKKSAAEDAEAAVDAAETN
jgi:WD40 repeat protein